MSYRLCSLRLLLGICALSLSAGSTAAAAANRTSQNMPLAFEPNEGQAPASVRYVVRAGAAEADLEDKRVHFIVPGRGGKSSTLNLEFAGAQRAAPIRAYEPLPGRSNYLFGKDPSRWVRNVKNYARVRYEGVYPGVDILFYGNGRELEHDFQVAPGADASRIALAFRDAHGLRITGAGDLAIETSGGIITLRKPVAYQSVGGHRTVVPARFIVARDGRVRFQLGAYDRKQLLTIDPVLDYSTYLDVLQLYPSAIAADAAGNTYVTGITANALYPVTAGAFQTNCPECSTSYTVFVTKFNAAGTAQIYSTFLGGNGYNQSTGMAVDARGNAIVVGYTGALDFPVKNPVASGATYGGVFITSLTPDGSALIYSSVLGGADKQEAVTVDQQGNAFVASTGDPAVFPVTAGALNNAGRTLVSKFSPSGSVVYNAVLGDASPQIGGAGASGPTAIAVDGAGSAYVTGAAGPLWPTTPGAYLGSIPGSTFRSAFLAKLKPDGSAFDYSTYVGDGIGWAIALDDKGDAWITGQSDDPSFPSTTNAYDTNGASLRSFFSEMGPQGAKVLYSSFLPWGQSAAVSVDGSNNIWIAGEVGGNSLTLKNPLFSVPDGGYVNEFDPTGTTLEFSTYMPQVMSMAVDPMGKAHIASMSEATAQTTAGAFIRAAQAPPANGGFYGSAAVIDVSTPAPAVCANPGALLLSSSPTLQITNCGNAPLTFQSITTSDGAFAIFSSSCTGTLAAGGACTLNVQYSPIAGASCEGAVIVASNASIPTYIAVSSGAPGCTAPMASVAFSPAYLTFGSQAVGTTSAPQTIRVLNTGMYSVSFTSIAASAEYPVSSDCGIALAPLANCNVSVSFSPLADGTRNAGVTFTDNGALSPQRVAVTGTATGLAPVVTLSPAVLFFSLAGVNMVSSPQTVTVTNSGQGALSISSVALQDTEMRAQFVETDNCSGLLAPGASCTAQVTFSTHNGMFDSGTLSISDNAADSPQAVMLLGNDGAYTAMVNPSSLKLAATNGAAAATVQITSWGGYNGTLAATCHLNWAGAPGITPTYPTCSANPMQFTVGPGGGSTTIVLSTGGQSAANRSAGFPWRSGTAVCAALAFFWVPRVWRRRAALLVVLIVVLVAGPTSCSGGGSGGSGGGGGVGGGTSGSGATVGNYTVSVNLSDGVETATATIALTVQ